MKELELSPYKIQVTQPLNEDHTQIRSEFAQLMLEKLQTGEIDVKKIWFSDVAYFTLDGCLNKQNYRYWGREKLEITVVRSLHPKKFLVWCAISSHGVFGPIFIDETLSAANYRKFLDEEFIPFLHGHDLVQGHWFMQDGARPHRTADVFEVLNEHFSDRIIALPRWYRMAPIFTRSEPLQLLPMGLFEEQSVADKSYEPSRTQNRHYNCCRHD
ncbi:t-complex protein 1 subunit delta [Nephila pilipes]|uniref:T-complex protein 1 subunit delta n=1 Tax=Nephila pilipes TaxID=299642 RepID=A0A8X6NNZ6_NEPPI|nr:t-complex protein 1 subunit delta [Nephila pilipes]